MSTIRFAGCLLLGFAICVAGTARADSLKPAPPRGADPFAGIVDRAQLVDAKATTIDDFGQKRVAVILSDATEKHLAWSEMASHGWAPNETARMRSMHGQDYVDRYTRLHHEAYDPEGVVNGAVEPLLRKAGSVEVIKDYSEFQSGSFDVLAVMDVTFVNTIKMGAYYFGSTYKAGAYMDVYFIDRGNTLLGKIEAGETRDVRGPPMFLDDAVAMRKDVIGNYKAQMDRLLGPDRSTPPRTAIAAPQPTPTAAMGKRPVAERLKEVESLVRQGLLNPAEAEAARKKILEDL